MNMYLYYLFLSILNLLIIFTMENLQNILDYNVNIKFKN